MLDAGLLLDSDAVYLTCGAEALPLLDASVDVVVARNSLDHVRDPGAVLSETARVLKPGGTLILNVDIDGEATAEEPHAFTVEDVRRLLGAAPDRARARAPGASRPRGPTARDRGRQARGRDLAL